MPRSCNVRGVRIGVSESSRRRRQIRASATTATHDAPAVCVEDKKMKMATPAERLQTAEEQIDWALSHPDLSGWLKDALRATSDCNPIEVLNDLEVLDTLVRGRACALIDRLLDPPEGKHRIESEAESDLTKDGASRPAPASRTW
jgi:hypothetical protein